MTAMDPLDAAMMTADLLSSPMHVGAVLILSPPADAGPDYVDQLYGEALAENKSIDPRLRRYPYRGVEVMPRDDLDKILAVMADPLLAQSVNRLLSAVFELIVEGLRY